MNTHTNGSRRSTTLRLAGLLTFSLALLMTACQPPATGPVPAPTPDKPDSSTTTQPGNTTVTTPADSAGYRKMKISWSADDFQEIQYNPAGQPVQYVSQYVNNLGTGAVRRTVYRLEYSPDKQLIRAGITEGAASSYVIYTYSGEQVSQTDQYTATGTLLAACTYRYSAPGKLSQVDEKKLQGIAMRRTYQYDANGNLSVLGIYEKTQATGAYELTYTIHYEEYDGQRDVENLLYHQPLLPGVLFRASNHRLKIIRDKDGHELSRERTAYVYNEQGYPVEQVRRGPGGTLIATYSY